MKKLTYAGEVGWGISGTYIAFTELANQREILWGVPYGVAGIVFLASGGLLVRRWWLWKKQMRRVRRRPWQ